MVVGISPGLSLDEHVQKYRSPTEGFDVLIYTGSGLMGARWRTSTPQTSSSLPEAAQTPAFFPRMRRKSEEA
jgi:hypothetical protein